MAQKRMFDKSITNSDNFLDLPDSSQILYFHLSMNADDDGFINNWKSIMRMTGTKQDDLKILIAKAFIIPFDSGVIVIRHWRLNNYLRSDRYKETTYKEEKALLELGENEEYLLKNKVGIPMVDTDKNRIDKNRIDYNIYGEFKNVKLTNDEYKKLEEKNLLPYIEKLSSYIASKGKKYKSHYATILTWSRKDISKEENDVPEWFYKDLDKEEDIRKDDLTDEQRERIERLIAMDRK